MLMVSERSKREHRLDHSANEEIPLVEQILVHERSGLMRNNL